MMSAQYAEQPGQVIFEEIPLSSYQIGAKAPAKIAENGKPEASFARPNGVFYLGISGWMNSFLAYPSLFCPAFVPVTWVNTTPESDNATYLWTYPTGEMNGKVGAEATSTDVDIFTFLPPSTSQSPRFDHNIQNAVHPAPVLTATAGGQDSTFTLMLRHKAANNQRIIAGGECGGNPMTGTYYACNYDRYWNSGKRNYQPALFAFNAEGTSEAWNQRLDVTGASLDAICEVFFKPQVPYTFNEANISFYNTSETPGNLKVTVYEVELDEQGNVTAIGRERASAVNSRIYNLQSNAWISYIFPGLQEQDPETGEMRDLLIDTPIMLAFSLNDPADVDTKLAVMYSIHPQYIPNDNHAYALVSHDGEASERQTQLVSCNLNSAVGYTTTFNAGINACYNYLYVGQDNRINVISDPVEKTFTVNAYKPSEMWKVTDADGNQLPDWISIACTDSTQEAYGYQFLTDVTVTVQPYQPGEATDCDIRLSILGADDVIHVTRSEVTAVTEIKPSVNKGPVRYFDALGRYVGTSLDSAPAGMYIGTDGTKIRK